MTDPSNSSPLALPFNEAVNPSTFLVQVKQAAEQQVRMEIAAHANRSLKPLVASAKLVMDSGTMQVVFEGGIPKGAQLMKSAGKALPVLVDGKTQKTLKVARAVTTGRKVATVTASAALVIVEAAHMISGHDNAKRLKVVEKGMGRLLHAHESGLKARLESIYRHSKEILHDGIDNLTEEDRRELHRQCRDLMELRARWREEFKHRIAEIDPAKPSWLTAVFRWRRDDSLHLSRMSKAEEADAAMEFVRLMHFSLMLQMTLAGVSGKMSAFRNVTLPDETASWRRVVDAGNEQVKRIGGDSGAHVFREFIGGLEKMADFWNHSNWDDGARPKMIPLPKQRVVAKQTRRGTTKPVAKSRTSPPRRKREESA